MASVTTTLLTTLAILSGVGNAYARSSSSSSDSSFNPLHHSGPASPYFDAPAQFGISSDTPAACKVEQAAYILRHGS